MKSGRAGLFEGEEGEAEGALRAADCAGQGGRGQVGIEGGSGAYGGAAHGQVGVEGEVDSECRELEVAHGGNGIAHLVFRYAGAVGADGAGQVEGVNHSRHSLRLDLQLGVDGGEVVAVAQSLFLLKGVEEVGVDTFG